MPFGKRRVHSDSGRHDDDHWRNAPGVFRKASETFFNFRSLPSRYENCRSACRHRTEFIEAYYTPATLSLKSAIRLTIILEMQCLSGSTCCDRWYLAEPLSPEVLISSVTSFTWGGISHTEKEYVNTVCHALNYWAIDSLMFVNSLIQFSYLISYALGEFNPRETYEHVHLFRSCS